jgi:flagellar hook-length control protein FliK
MNATPSISQSPPPSLSPGQPSAAAADQADRSNGLDFAGAMNAEGGKPARKPAAKEHNTAPGGSALPPGGNQTPPTAVPSPGPNAASTPSAPPATQAGPSAVSGNGAPTAAASAPASGPAAPPTDPSNTAPAVIGAEELATLNTVATAADFGKPSTPSGAAASMPSVAGASAPPTAAAAQPTAPVSAPSISTPPASAAAPAPKIAGGTASKSDGAAATSAPTSANADATQNTQAQASAPNAADADAAAQLAMAAAAAQGTSAPTPDSSAASDDLATPDTGVTLQGVAAANDIASPPPSGLSAHATAAPTSASVTAATAASIVQAASASADSGPADKRSRDNTPDGSAGAAQLLSSNAPSDAASGPTPTFKVSAGVDTADFGQGVADRVSLMVDSNLTSAKLQVNPPSLGPIEVRIDLQGGHAQVWMSSHSAVTRDALESTSPKLREMLNSQGFAQVSVDISQRSFQDRTPQPQPQAYESVSAIGSHSTAPAQVSAATARSASSLLDAYA